ncbi:hypothetical protein PoB_003482200 [Plakobranchus ocellatus]|uniref:BHLH domain-containing protein n=1 Tax=Plakobranchus ocellatus TaxID=259542 RepID=A0AAV4AM18_9GAST|nr:hypothetical protein PoB_003482200 [Plakobranchus ocellatus]
MAMDRPTFTNVCEATSQSHELDNMRPIHRKGKKLLAEKKRRARINNCLIQIRDLVCEGSEEKDSDVDKMEKAEILEKTLEVLTRYRREYNTMSFSPSGNRTGLHSSPSARQVMAVRYASGFSSCAEESIRYIQGSRLVPAEVKAQLQNHLRAIAHRMESRVSDIENLPAVSPGSSQFTPQYPLHPYSAQPSVMPRAVSSVLPVSGDLVSSSHPHEVEPGSGIRMPSPIHTSTPVTSHPCHNDQEDIASIKSEAPNDIPTAFRASYRYECITPEIDVVAEGDGKPVVTHSKTQITQHLQHRLPPTPEHVTFQSPYHRISPNLPITSTPVRVHPPQTSLSDSSLPCCGKESNQQSFRPPSHTTFIHPNQTSISSPSTFSNTFSSSASPSISHTIYTYHGYEPLPASSVNTPSLPLSHLHNTASIAVNKSHCPISSTSLSDMKPQTTPSTPALNLCVKTHASHQISPETMWRPW